MRRVPVALCFVVVLAVALALLLTPASADGPWRGQIVDKETGQPLEDVVVLAYWIRLTGTIAGWGGAKYAGAEEVVTGPDGHFVIPGHSTVTVDPTQRIKGPELVIYKPGYGQWRFQGSDTWPQDVLLAQEEGRKAWKRFAGPGAVIELPSLGTKEERLQMLRAVGWPDFVPHAKTRRLRQFEEQERRHLGLGGGRP